MCRLVAQTSAGVINLNKLHQADSLNGRSTAVSSSINIEVLFQATLDPLDPLNSCDLGDWCCALVMATLLQWGQKYSEICCFQITDTSGIWNIFQNVVLLLKKSCCSVVNVVWYWPVSNNRAQVNFSTPNNHCTCLVATFQECYYYGFGPLLSTAY